MNEESFRPAWRSFYWHILGVAVCLVIAGMVSVKLADGNGKTMAEILFILLALAVVVHMLFRRYRVTLVVKPDEIALEVGVIGRNSIEISTRSIRTIQVKQSLLQRILNVGDILIASSGTEEYEIYAANMPAPHAIRDKMQAYERALGKGTDEGKKSD
ncbi:MAG: PH domain-containing protein [Synergistaceae bacterium]|nr:PH domain-containing protein [Synergistaceae bacterium]